MTAPTKRRDIVEALAAFVKTAPSAVFPFTVGDDLKDRMIRAALAGGTSDVLLAEFGDVTIRDGYRERQIRHLDRPFSELTTLVHRARTRLRVLDGEIKRLQETRADLANLLEPR